MTLRINPRAVHVPEKMFRQGNHIGNLVMTRPEEKTQNNHQDAPRWGGPAGQSAPPTPTKWTEPHARSRLSAHQPRCQSPS
jgi:hypothetical protein